MKQYTGKNVDEILASIAAEKNVTTEDITYTVIEEKAGFLGVGKEVTIEAYTKADIKDYIYDYLQQYFENIEMDIEMMIEEQDNFYKINLNASNNAILIGKAGQTLQAMNNVLKAAVSSHFKKRVSCLIDINGYKDERYKKVIGIATRVAKTVVYSKTDALLDPMPNDERKAIHNHLTTMPHVATVSEGEGNQRRLKIVYVEED
ncbi:spoIIIJ-associated protein [Breznakia sp. PF5-3]|uniref:KH domain-containing protein n=1 Tax=unclassified Breznakia TaxID=2623764 RepID=UPI0024065834|nr:MULTISPECIES: KH domain-containing protein [unclassified Breznakia]MDL2276021.1 KH domain-containing protein [Breznakia sp. OttesenSCG-928-G09]MDF9824336.1 spoIIIJ-associated protein [Breznakia sp. PM6-1]MDF9835073.1 spoIIIJ-associated protein [Breznakia sp. PF5-3]MDF9837756.1 spoIIIJ-associated protein [Breznakia sp. PFB2-8]MDF9859635.1 spoIIIJ-associated protein [Breznakia sp. PH5-24]